MIVGSMRSMALCLMTKRGQIKHEWSLFFVSGELICFLFSMVSRIFINRSHKSTDKERSNRRLRLSCKTHMHIEVTTHTRLR